MVESLGILGWKQSSGVGQQDGDVILHCHVTVQDGLVSGKMEGITAWLESVSSIITDADVYVLSSLLSPLSQFQKLWVTGSKHTDGIYLVETVVHSSTETDC